MKENQRLNNFSPAEGKDREGEERGKRRRPASGQREERRRRRTGRKQERRVAGHAWIRFLARIKKI